MDAEVILEKLPAPEGKKRLVERRQDTYDIIRQILKKHKGTAAHYDSISKDFWKGNAYNTARALFDFCKTNIGYVVEPVLKQSTKTPAAILIDKNGDCKHYASFIVGVAESLRRKGYPIQSFYRFASYDRNKRSPGHVFAVVIDGSKQYWVDPVLNTFDQRTPEYFYKQDKIPPMADKIGELYDISGISNDATLGRSLHWLDDKHRPGRHLHNRRPHFSHAWHMQHDPPPPPMMSKADAITWMQQHNMPVPKVSGTHWLDELPPPSHMRVAYVDEMGKLSLRHLHIKDKLKHIKIRPGKLFKKVFGAVPRNAFLGLVKKNAFHMAQKFHEARKQKGAMWKKITDKWEKLGGNGNKLETAISQGINNYNRHHSTKITGYEEGGLGEMYEPLFMHQENGHVGVAVVDDIAGLLAAAAPILALFKGILHSLGVNTKKVDDDVATADDKLASDHNDGEASADDDGVADHGSGTKTKATVKDGKQTLEIHKTSADDDPDIADTDDGSSASGSKPSRKKTAKASATDDGGTDDSDDGGGTSKVSQVFHQIEDFVKDHWKGLAIGTMGFIVVVKVLSNRRRPVRRR